VSARLLGVLALLVLAGCGVTALLGVSAPASLAGRSNWALATTLPGAADVDPDWGYSLNAPLAYATAPPQPEALDSPWPEPVLSPPHCAPLPDLLVIPGTRVVSVTAESEPRGSAIAVAVPAGAATGFIESPRPDMAFRIWAPADALTAVDRYREWLAGCGSYEVDFTDPRTSAHRHGTISTVIDPDPDVGAEASVTVTRSLTESDTHTRHVGFYAIRGLLLECSTSMGPDRVAELNRLCVRTAERLRAL